MISIKNYSDDCQEKWDDFITASSQGSLFQTTLWKTVIEQTFGYQSCYVFAEEDGKVTGVLPLFLVKKPVWGRAFISVPFGVYGGICADSLPISQVLKQKGEELARTWRVDFLELRQQESNGLDLPTKDLYATFMREIFDGEEKNMAAIPRKQRRMIRQGIGNDLRSRLGGRDDLKAFYNIYSSSLRNLGTPAFPYRYFEVLFDRLGDRCKILSVWLKEKMVASVMAFFYKDRVMPYYGGALPQYVRYAVYDFMYWELMRYGWEHGYKIFDFGRSKNGTGAFDFKRHWGFEPTPLPYQYYLPKGGAIPNMSPTNPKFQPFITLWRKLPLPVANLIGPHIIKYLP